MLQLLLGLRKRDVVVTKINKRGTAAVRKVVIGRGGVPASALREVAEQIRSRRGKGGDKAPLEVTNYGVYGKLSCPELFYYIFDVRRIGPAPARG